MIFRWNKILAIAIGVTIASSGYTQSKQSTAEPTLDSDQITLNLEDADIAVLVNMIAEVTGKNFVIDPRVKGKVSVVSGKALNKDQLYNVFLSILEVNNFATVDSGEITKIVPSNLVKQRPTPTVFSETNNQGQSTPSDANDAQITQVVRLKYTPVQELMPIIRPLIPATSHFAPHVPTNSLVITDTSLNIQRVLEIIGRIDVPDKRSNLRVLYLTHANATATAATLNGVLTKTKSDQPATETPISIQPSESINALIISATDDDFLKVKALIDELDIDRPLDPDVTVMYLKHANAVDLVPILNTTTATTRGDRADVSVQADEATNSLVIKAEGNKLDVMKSVISKLDIRRAQVFVETIIAEVSMDQSANLGLDWRLGDPDNPVQILNSPNGTNIGAATTGTDFNLQSNGFTYSLLDFRKYRLDVIINALRSDVNSNILSTPTILTLDNEEAEIVVGQEVPFITGRFDSGTGGSSTSTDANGNTVVVNSSNQFQTIERKDVGIKLKIKPQISEGDTIQLEVSQEISSVSTATVQGQADLITNRRSIEAVVQVDDGQVVVLGGLIQDDVVDTVESVPILGSIPILGLLFRNTNKVAVKRNLMVFLKPRIIRSSSDLVEYSRNKYEDVRIEGLKPKKKTVSDLILGGANPPILDSYDQVTEEGVITTQQRRKKRERVEKIEARREAKRKAKRMKNKKKGEHDDAIEDAKPVNAVKDKEINDF